MSNALIRKLTTVAVTANLIGQVLIIVTGGAVRLTGSGLGCSTWPQCEPGSFVPVIHAATEFHVYVEYGNRLVGVALGIIGIALAVLMTVWTKRAAIAPDRARLSYAIIGGVVLQGAIGGASVHLDLHPAIVGSHFLISGVLVSLSTVLAVRWCEGDDAPTLVGSLLLRRLGWALLALAAVVVILGVIVTGAGPHSGDEEVGYRFALDPYEAARFHSASVWLFVLTLAAFVVVTVRTRPSPTVRARAWILVAVTLAQGVIGYVQFFSGLPELLVGLHMLGAAVLIVTVTALLLSLRQRGPARRIDEASNAASRVRH